jgi:DNA-binding GntR family transcriptional regulator
MTLKRATLAEQAYEELRTRIVSGALQAGSRLLAEELAAQLAISPTPVKEALALLERDGLVEGNSRRASVVRRFRAGDVRHIFAARMMLELDAMRHGAAAGTITPSFVADLADVFRRQVEHARTHRPVIFGEAVRLDREFHETLLRLAANPITAAWHRGVLAQTQTILTYSFDTYDAERAHSEHAAIIEALRSGDPSQIEASLRAHLIASRDAILNRRPILDEAAA